MLQPSSANQYTKTSLNVWWCLFIKIKGCVGTPRMTGFERMCLCSQVMPYWHTNWGERIDGHLRSLKRDICFIYWHCWSCNIHEAVLIFQKASYTHMIKPTHKRFDQRSQKKKKRKYTDALCKALMPWLRHRSSQASRETVSACSPVDFTLWWSSLSSL